MNKNSKLKFYYIHFRKTEGLSGAFNLRAGILNRKVQFTE